MTDPTLRPFDAAPAAALDPDLLAAALGPTATPTAIGAATRALAFAEDVAAAPWPRFAERLLAIGRVDAVLARLVEGHLDAHRILHELGAEPVPGALYGVWASKSGGSGWSAQAADEDATSFRIDGRLRFASGAGILDRALVTVPGGSAEQLLDLEVAGLDGDPGGWRTDAMRRSRSLDLHGEGRVLAGRRIGPEGAYLGRWGFLPGGVGVAAAWAGGAMHVLDLVGEQPPNDDAARIRLGRARTDALAAIELVRAAARGLESTRDDREAAARIAALVRAAVVAGARRVIAEAKALSGPARLAFDGRLAEAVADLELYLAQHHDDRSYLAIGAEVETDESPGATSGASTGA